MFNEVKFVIFQLIMGNCGIILPVDRAFVTASLFGRSAEE